MDNKKKIIIIVLILIFLVAGSSVLYKTFGSSLNPQGNIGNNGSSTEKVAAPDFVVYDKDGKEVRLSEYKGKPVVLNFWASWCPPCRMEMPDFQEKYLKEGEEIVFLMVNLTKSSDETFESASDFIEKEGYTFPVFYDKDLNAKEAYDIMSIPTTYFIDSEGNIAAQYIGAIDKETLQSGIDLIKLEQEN
ncbi:MAG: TlpA family protein disulfide reductase [Ruminococcaceae bacterium]|jgi:peroxiredoxin|nr:TlpA family protein disulfide reductase [Oscillospiraceae bacterium]